MTDNQYSSVWFTIGRRMFCITQDVAGTLDFEIVEITGPDDPPVPLFTGCMHSLAQAVSQLTHAHERN